MLPCIEHIAECNILACKTLSVIPKRGRTNTTLMSNILYKPSPHTSSSSSRPSYLRPNIMSCQMDRVSTVLHHCRSLRVTYPMTYYSNISHRQQLRSQTTIGTTAQHDQDNSYSNNNNNNNMSSSSAHRVKDTCVLCDEPYTDWGVHSRKVAHIARETVCDVFVSPERHEQMMNQLWEHIRLDFQQIDELSQKKISRRRTRLGSTLEYLVEQGVLRHSIPNIASPSPHDTPHTNDIRDSAHQSGNSNNTGSPLNNGTSTCTVVINNPARFYQFFTMGEGYLVAEGIDRLGRLLPRISGNALMNLCDYVTSPIHLRSLFEAVHLEKLIMTAANFNTNSNAENTVPAIKITEADRVQINKDPIDSAARNNCKNGDEINPDNTTNIAAASTNNNADRAAPVENLKKTDLAINETSTVSLPRKKPTMIAPKEKVAILLAILGELRYYISQRENLRHSPVIPPPQSNTGAPSSNNITFLSEQLVLNVLAGHCSENLVSELIHGVLQQLVDECTPVWNEYKATLPSKVLKNGLYTPEEGIGARVTGNSSNVVSTIGGSVKDKAYTSPSCTGAVNDCHTSPLTLSPIPTAPKDTSNTHHQQHSSLPSSSTTVENNNSNNSSSNILSNGVSIYSHSPFFTEPLGLLTVASNPPDPTTISVEQYIDAMSSDTATLTNQYTAPVPAHSVNTSLLIKDSSLTEYVKCVNAGQTVSGKGSLSVNNNNNEKKIEYFMSPLVPKLSVRPTQ